jgi:hypothetical protein
MNDEEAKKHLRESAMRALACDKPAYFFWGWCSSNIVIDDSAADKAFRFAPVTAGPHTPEHACYFLLLVAEAL